MLIHDQAVQFDKCHLGRHGVKTVPNQRVFEKLGQERFVSRIHFQFGYGRIIRSAGLFLFQGASEIVGRLPFVREGPLVGRFHGVISDKAKVPLECRTPDQIQVLVRHVLICRAGSLPLPDRDPLRFRCFQRRSGFDFDGLG